MERSCTVRKNSKKSLFPLKRAIAINPKNTFAQKCLADSFLKLGKENECFFTIQKALSISPRETSLHCLIIKILKERNQLDDLLSFYQKTADMIKDKISVSNLYYCSAEILYKSKIMPQPLELYKKAIETNIMSGYQRAQYAEILNREGLFEEAIVQYEHLSKLEPTDPFVLNNIASLHYEIGRVQKAFEGFEEIRQKGLLTIMTYPNFILVMYHLGKDEEAIKTYQKTLPYYPQRDKDEIKQSYKTQLRVAEEKLVNDIDEDSRDFYTKKVKALNMVFSLLNSPHK